jgi:hypothetical protein
MAIPIERIFKRLLVRPFFGPAACIYFGLILCMLLFLHRTVAIDMRGYGDSDKPEGLEAYQIDQLTEDIKQLVLALGKYNVDFFFVVNASRHNANNAVSALYNILSILFL